jgi:glycogenin
MHFQQFANSWDDKSQDRGLFEAPAPPAPPKDMYYQAPDHREERLKPIFPWEADASPATRVFPGQKTPPQQPAGEDLSHQSNKTDDGSSGVGNTPPDSPESTSSAPTDPWQSYARTNAWDDDPNIDKYVSGMQGSRRGGAPILKDNEEQILSPTSEERHSMRLTDFPTEVERPSLPVTPAPRRRSSFWGQDKDEEVLPSAAGVPPQAEWVYFALDDIEDTY